MIKRFWWLLLNAVLLLFILSTLKVSGDEPPTELKITIPDYEVSRVTDFDYVSIPGGHVFTC
ncbi:MAG: hypothetical protein QXY99_07775, partial [Thermoproteota archaeon]